MSVQRGFAMIAILALIALIAAFLISSALYRTAADVSNEREDRNMSALRKAKAALIAYAASEQWQLYKSSPTYFQPGALACPDQDDDGDADCTLPNTANLIGRVPYKTIGLDDLRDASGERLWYALSHDFRKLRCTGPGTPLGCTVINSDTQGQLTVVGTAPATQVVAVLFAPGEALDLTAVGGPLQDRIVGHNDPLNYIEGPPVVPTGSTNWVFTTGPRSASFNDRVLIITKAELMDAVEPVVAANIERDIKPLVQAYFTKWGAYPFAMPFAAPPASVTAYYGASGQTQGLLPLTDDPSWFKWAFATVMQVPPGTGSPTVTSWNCSIDSSPWQAVCHVSYCCTFTNNDRPDIKIEIFLQNANTAFADIPSPITAPENFTIAKDGGGFVSNQGSPYGQFSDVGSAVPFMDFATQTAVAAQTGVIIYTGRLQNAQSMNGGVTITIPLPTPQYLPITSSNPATNPNGAWFISNQWYRQAYYAVSPGYVSGVSWPNPASCSPLPATPSCLTVKNLGPVPPASCTPLAPSTDPCSTVNKQALLILSGRALNSPSRPPWTLTDYLESANLTAANGTTPFVYEHRAGVPTAINDRAVVVSP